MNIIKKNIFSEKSLWFILLLYSILEIAIFMVTPFIYKFFIDNVIDKKELKFLFLIILLFFISYVFVVLFGFLKEVISTKLTQKVIQKTREDYYVKLKKTKLTYIKSIKVGSEMTVLLNEVNDIITQYISLYNNIFVNSLRIIVACIILSFLNFKLLIILVFCLPLYIILTNIFKKRISRNAQDYNSIREGYINKIHDGILGYEDIVTYKRKVWDINNVNDESKRFIKNRVNSVMLLRASSDISYLFYWAIICVIYYISALNIIEGDFSLGLMLVYVSYVDNIYSPSRIVLSSIAGYKNAKSQSINFDQKYKTMNNHEIKLSNSLLDNKISFNEINFSNIKFNYNSENDINFIINNFHLNSGDKIGLFGESGAGKTTLLKIISGLYHPISGNIIIDNQYINSEHLCDISVICSQNPYLFSITLKDNINFSNIITDDKGFINLVYEQLGIYDLENMNLKELSGGQYHRIALARALISEAKLYIFDEPTANIDIEKRKAFYNLLEQLSKKGKIIIVSTHNENELKNFGRIFNVSHGEFF